MPSAASSSAIVTCSTLPKRQLKEALAEGAEALSVRLS